MKVVFSKKFRICFALLCTIFTITLFFIPVLSFDSNEIPLFNSFYEYSCFHTDDSFFPILITRYLLAIIISLCGILISFKSPLGLCANFTVFYAYAIMFQDQFLILIPLYEGVKVGFAYIITVILNILIALYTILYFIQYRKLKGGVK